MSRAFVSAAFWVSEVNRIMNVFLRTFRSFCAAVGPSFPGALKR